MKRREFLQAGAVVLAGANAAPAATAQPPEADGLGRVLITCAEDRLAKTIGDHLSSNGEVRLTSTVDVQSKHPFVRSDLDHSEATDALVDGVDSVVFVNKPPVGANADEQIDYRTRLTYNVLFAARAKAVRRVVLLSSLYVLTDYDQDFEVDEFWRPLPTTEVESLSMHLSEFTVREFAREKTFEVVVLRLGHVVRSEEVSGKSYDSMWVDERDVAQAVESALKAGFRDHPSGIRTWNVYHVQSDSQKSRFTSRRAKGIGYKPAYFGDAK